jgi:hypothetical protein
MKNNKHCSWLISALLVMGFVMVSCSTTYHYEKDAPVETQATLKISGPYQTIVALDEVGVKWKGSFFGNTAILPAGPHTLTVNYKEGGGVLGAIAKTDSWSVYAKHLSQNFLPGHTYNLTAQRTGDSVTFDLTEVPAVKGGK